MVVNLTRPVGTVISDNAPTAKGDHRTLFNDVIAAVNGLDPLVTPSYASRASAESGAPSLAPSIAQIIVREGNALVFRSRGASADDPLFADGSRWGVVLRIDPTQIDVRSTPSYASRAAAVTGAASLPAGITDILVREGTALVIRSRTASADDPLFAAPAVARWGVVQRQDAAAATPVRMPVRDSDAAGAKNANAWTVAPVYRDVINAVITFPAAAGPAGVASPHNAQVDVVPHARGVRQIWRDANGSVFDRVWNGTAWTGWTLQPSATSQTTEQTARIAGDTANAQAHEGLRTELAAAPDAGADVGRALIHYREGGQRVALGQREDGLDFIPSQRLRDRLGSGGGGADLAPAGGWAGQDVDGVTFFTAPAGCGLIDRFRLDGSRWILSPRMARVICHYGQSNAGVTLMNEPLHWPGAPVRHCVTLNDRTPTNGGVRGLIGQSPTITPTALEPVVEVGRVQSIVSATGALLAILDQSVPKLNVVRTEARGGQPFIGTNDNIVGIWKTVAGVHSIIFDNLIRSITDMVNISADEGFPVETIYIPFTHQENDRADTRANYLANWRGFKADVEAALASLGKPIIWLLDQASGSGWDQDGGAWPNRMSVYDATLSANGGANVFMVMPRYHLPFGPGTTDGWDWIHHAYASRVVQGETLGYAIEEIEAGRNWRCAWPVSSSIVGNTVVINFDSITPLMIDPSFCKVRPNMGFSVAGRTVVGVSVTGPRQVTVSCDGPPAAGALLAYAYRAKDAQDIKDEWPISTGALRETWEMPSKFVSGARILRPALGFQIAIGG